MRIGDFNQPHAIPQRPLAAAKAYGIRPPQPAVPLKLAAPVADSPAASSKAQDLVAGSVKTPISFDAPQAQTERALRLYTRSADAVEAATGVELGRTIDLKA